MEERWNHILLTVLRFAVDGVQNIPRISAPKEKDIRRFFWRNISRQAYCRCVSNGIEIIFSLPNEGMSHW